MQDRSSNQGAVQLSQMEFGRVKPPAADSRWLHGDSDVLRRLRQHATAIAGSTCAAVVIAGEPGVGKRRLAQWLHAQRHGWQQPPAELRAPSAAQLDAVPRAEASALLLHDIHRLDAAATERLTALIAQKQLPRGVIMTTTVSLSQLRQRSLAHEQLFGRLTDAVLDIAPLRTRTQDIPAVARALLQQATIRYGSKVRGLSPAALTALEQLPLPGNARQLAAMIEQATLSSEGDWISERDLGADVGEDPGPGGRTELRIRLPGASLREIEMKALTLALELADGRIVRAAELLGITRHALRRKLEKFGLEALRSQPATGPARGNEDDAFI